MKTNCFFTKRLDIFSILVIFIASFIFYYLGCKALLTAGFYQQINVAFDLDQSHFFHSISHDTDTERLLLIKHPFIYLYNYIVLALNIIGLSDALSVIILSQLFHSASLVVSYIIFRVIGRTILEASFLTFGLAGTSTYISSGFVLDVYTISIFWISAIFLITCIAEYKNIISSVWLRAIVSIMAIGTTSYLIILVFLMEFYLVKKAGDKIYTAFSNCLLYKQLIRVFILGIILFNIIYFQILVDIFQDPVGVFKRVFWTVNRPGEKEGIIQVISVFSLFSIISPKVSSILLPEGITMIDLRVIDFSVLGWLTLIMLLISVFSKINNEKHRGVFLFCFFWLIINIFFHTIYQYRGSLFLYTGHFILAVWIIYFTPGRVFEDYIGWKKKVYYNFDVLLIYVLPFLIWGNNLYLYKEIMKFSV